MATRAELDAARRAITLSFDTHASLCAPFLDILPVAGIAVSVLATPAAQMTICASDSVAARLDELQFDLGEGPCWDAMTTHQPVFEGDFADTDSLRWPAFAPEAGALVRAVYAFPMSIGSLQLGAIDLYSREPLEISAQLIADAVELTAVASWQVARRILGADDPEEQSGYSRHEIHQATGMVLAQLDVAASDAMLLLRMHAYANGRSVREIANDVVERRLSFEPEPS
jgi:hypothetical protein